MNMLLAELAAKSVVVAAMAIALLALLKNRSAAERSWIAHAALAVLLALPLAALFGPRWRVLGPDDGADAAPAAAARLEAAMFDPLLVAQALYAGGAGLILLGTGIGVARLVGLRRQARVVLDADWLSALARAQDRMGLKSGAALLVSDAVASPVSWGVVRPTIVLNPGVIGSRTDAEAIIAHELAHVVRLDWAKLLISRLAIAAFWFNPLVWLLAAQCHHLREEAADDAVLRGNVRSTDYASLLVEAARHECRGVLIAAHGVAPGKNSLHRRVARVLDAAARRTPTKGPWAFGSLVAAVALASPLAAVTLERAEATAPEPAKVTVASAPSPEVRIAPPAAIASPAATTVRGYQQDNTAPASTVNVRGFAAAPGRRAGGVATARSFEGRPDAAAAGPESVVTVRSMRSEPHADAPPAGLSQSITSGKSAIVSEAREGVHILRLEADGATLELREPEKTVAAAAAAGQAKGRAKAEAPPTP